jgi:hypothetical protein
VLLRHAPAVDARSKIGVTALMIACRLEQS